MEIIMKLSIRNWLCRILVISAAMLPFQSGQAGMIVTDQVASSVNAQEGRDTVINLLSRAGTASEFQTLGLDSKAAADRVAAMTDDEVSTLAGKINAVPAGADGLVVLILVVFFIWYFAFRR
jgi:hypothetical protein